jgi:hypothetical protein
MRPEVQEIPFSAMDLADGRLGVIEFSIIGFQPKRIYWISNVPIGGTRGHHAHRELRQLIWVVSGSVSIDLYAGESITTFNLNPNSPALSLEPGFWRVLRNFTADANVLVLCDRPFEEFDYIRDFDMYKEWYREVHA